MFDFCCNLYLDEFFPLLSDVHNLFSLKICFKTIINANVPKTDETVRNIKLWDSEHPEKFVDSIDILKLCEIENSLDNLVSLNICEQSDLDSIVQDISRLFRESAYTAYGEKFMPCNINDKKQPNASGQSLGKPWYNKERETARQDFTRAKNIYERSKTQTNREIMRIKGKCYRWVNHIHSNIMSPKMQAE